MKIDCICTQKYTNISANLAHYKFSINTKFNTLKIILVHATFIVATYKLTNYLKNYHFENDNH